MVSCTFLFFTSHNVHVKNDHVVFLCKGDAIKSEEKEIFPIFTFTKSATQQEYGTSSNTQVTQLSRSFWLMSRADVLVSFELLLDVKHPKSQPPQTDHYTQTQDFTSNLFFIYFLFFLIWS